LKATDGGIFMATAVVEKAIVLKVPAEILGPGSEYEERRLALKHEYEGIIAKAKTLTVVDSPESAERANEFGRLLQAGSKEAETFFKPIKQQIDGFKAPVLAHEKEFAGALDVEKRRLGGLLTTYNAEVQRLAEIERQKQQAAAEQAAREAVLARAVEIDESGDSEQAAALLEEPIYVPAVVVQNAAPAKVAGQVGTTTYGAKVTGWEEKMTEKPTHHPGWQNLMNLVKAVASGLAPIQSLQPNETFLNQQGKSYREGFSLPGCELTKKTGTHFRS
jgi:hypothetical protein